MDPIRSEESKVISPFADREHTISDRKGKTGTLLLIGGSYLALVIIGVLAGIFITRYLNNPYRTLETFPVAKYLDNYQGLAGSKFKAIFRVEADLGWKDGAGRLMLFSTADDPRPIAVLIPATVAKGLYFDKGQNYMAEVEVKEGGLIYADLCQKN